MLATIRLYYMAHKALEPLALTLERDGRTDLPLYRDYVAYRVGWELAKAEFLASVGA